MYCSHQYLSIDQKKVCHAHFNAHKPLKTCDVHNFHAR